MPKIILFKNPDGSVSTCTPCGRRDGESEIDHCNRVAATAAKGRTWVVADDVPDPDSLHWPVSQDSPVPSQSRKWLATIGLVRSRAKEAMAAIASALVDSREAEDLRDRIVIAVVRLERDAIDSPSDEEIAARRDRAIAAIESVEKIAKG